MSAWRTCVCNFNVMITSDRVLRLVKQQNRGGNCLSFNLVDIVCLSAALLRREGQLLDTNRFPALPSDIFNHNMVSIEEEKKQNWLQYWHWFVYCMITSGVVWDKKLFLLDQYCSADVDWHWHCKRKVGESQTIFYRSSIERALSIISVLPALQEEG